MYKRDDNNNGKSVFIEISTPFSAGKHGEIYSDNRESWLKNQGEILFSLLK